jgi:hypothetical protein
MFKFVKFYLGVSLISKKSFFEKLIELEGGHWTKDMAETRWDYHHRVKKIVKSLRPTSPKTILEIGTVGISIVEGSDTLDYLDRWDFPGKNPTFIHDARKSPWPILDKQYKILIATRVFQHLAPNQKDAFFESLRVSSNVILVVPESYKNPVLPNSQGITYAEFVDFLDGVHPNRFERTKFGELYHWDVNNPSKRNIYY